MGGCRRRGRVGWDGEEVGRGKEGWAGKGLGVLMGWGREGWNSEGNLWIDMHPEGCLVY